MAFMDDPNAAALAWRMEGLVNGRDKVSGGPTAGEDLTKLYDRVAADVASKIPVAVPPTDDQVNTAVAQVMNDPAWLAEFGHAVVSAFKQS